MNGMRWCMVWIWCFAAGSAFGQVNIERLRGDHWEPGVAASLDLNFSFRAGNVDIWEFGPGGRLGYTRARSQSFLVGHGDLGWKDGNRFSNALLLHGRHIHRLQQRVYAEGFAQLNYDKARLLDFRGLLGGGMRLGVVYAGAVKLWWGTAYMLERERIDPVPGDVHPAQVWHHRWSNYLSASARVNDRAGLSGAVYVQPRFDAMADVRVLGDATMGMDMSDRVRMVSALNVRYDARPPATVEKWDVKLTTGISVRW